MSNMTLFKGANLPSRLKNQELDDVTKSLMGGGGGSTYKRISIKGNVFRMVAGGKEIATNEDRAMNIVIAAAAPKTSRQYYAGTYQEGVVSAPDCWSADGEAPSPTIESPKSTTCAQCPMNIAGSGQGTGRACRYTHRLAVLLENDIKGDVYELSLAATSLFGKGENGKMPLFQYAKQLAGHGLNVTDVVTELRFDTDSATPKMVFRAVRPLEVAEIDEVLDKATSLEAIQAITTSYTAGRAEVVAPAPKAVPQGLFADPSVSEPVVREKKAAASVATPTDLESTLAEWAD